MIGQIWKQTDEKDKKKYYDMELKDKENKLKEHQAKQNHAADEGKKRRRSPGKKESNFSLNTKKIKSLRIKRETPQTTMTAIKYIY
jgi:hypothetical protein